MKVMDTGNWERVALTLKMTEEEYWNWLRFNARPTELAKDRNDAMKQTAYYLLVEGYQVIVHVSDKQ